MPAKRIDVLICCGSGCVSAGALKIKEKMNEVLKTHDLLSEIKIIETGCMGPCDYGPVMMIYPEGIFYKKVSENDVEEIVAEHFIKGRPLKRLMITEGENKVMGTIDEIPFYQKQTKVALHNCGYINPDSLEEYIALGGYEALGEVLTNKTPEETIDIILKSGLRGRGGGGFPTGKKWQFVRNSKGSPKYVVCN
ncbi:MAG: NAD(P)H-dependent oxidoreductase subunit E, partial [Candidatus Cloacimonetes bacterium]|nr:NAD(P)H-dependent oxidoreductase subunit E [Candidatus Cloacimonadota bacterium]